MVIPPKAHYKALALLLPGSLNTQTGYLHSLFYNLYMLPYMLRRHNKYGRTSVHIYVHV